MSQADQAGAYMGTVAVLSAQPQIEVQTVALAMMFDDGACYVKCSTAICFLRCKATEPCSVCPTTCFLSLCSQAAVML